MNSLLGNLGVLLFTGLVVFGLCLGLRRRAASLSEVDPSPWSSTLSYVATAYGVVVGFSILFLFGQVSAARSAVGDEATSIGTAFQEAALFPAAGPGIQRALICYAEAVPEYDWPAMRDGSSAPEVDNAFAGLVAATGESDLPTTGALNSAAATNLMSQVGSISTAREARLVTATTRLPPMLWALVMGGGLLVIALIFFVTLPAGPKTQAILVAMSALFTAVLVLIVLALNRPFADEAGRVSPELIEQTASSMGAAAPDLAAEPCDYSSK